MKKLICSLPWLALFFHLSAQVSTDQLFDVTVKGKGDPVILIPGLACSGAVWDQTVEKLSDQYECHIFTLGGFAGTQAFPGSDTSFLPKIKKGIIQYIDQQAMEKPVIIGHSLGGFMALSIAAEAPQLLKRIIIVDSYPFFSAAMNPAATVEQARPQAQMMKTMMINQTTEVFESQQKQSMPTMATQADDIEKIIHWSLASDRPTVAQAMYELMTTDLRAEAEKVFCPILVFGSWYAAKDYGITSDMVKNNYQQQFQMAKDYKILMADTARHFIMLDEFDWFIGQVNTFLK